jgi:hypothetical protein
MNARRLLLAATALAALAPAHGAADRFTRTKAQIDALLARRITPVPLPPQLPNPFQVTAETPRDAVRGGEPEPPRKPPVEADTPPTDDAGILAYYAQRLRITGQVELNGRAHLIINQSPYKEGDLVLLHDRDTILYLRVEKIAPTELVLSYNTATISLPLKN